MTLVSQILFGLTACALSMSSTSAQVQPGTVLPGGRTGANPVAPGAGGVQQPGSDRLLPDAVDRGRGTVRQRNRRQLPIFQEFPVVLPPGFGAYPGGALPQPYGGDDSLDRVPSLPGVPRSENSWPSWFEDGGDGEFPIDVGLLRQQHDAIWLWEREDSPAPVRLIAYDRFRKVEAGARFEIRGKGSAVLQLRGAARLRCDGPTLVAIDEMSERTVLLDARQMTRLSVESAPERPIQLRVGAAGIARIEGTSCSVVRHGGLVEVVNTGTGTLRWQDGREPLIVPPAHRVTVLPGLRRADPIGTALQVGGRLERSDEGRTATFTATETGSVEWGGARFELRAGMRLRIDPLNGDRLPENRETNER